MTLTSDFGPAYAAQVKGVLLRSLPPGTVVDLSHELRAHRIPEAGFLLRAMAGGFPAGSVHMAVVDPGVGSTRAAVVVATKDGSRLVGPDNGVLWPLAEQLGRPRGYRILPERLGVAGRVGTTFDGRDLFAPAAVRLALGAHPRELGPPVDVQRLSIPEASRGDGWLCGEVVHVDHFGNLVTNIPSEWVPRTTTTVRFRVGRRAADLRWTTRYEGGSAGRSLALGSSFGTVEIAVALGSAARAFGADVGAPVRFRPGPSRPSTRKYRPAT